MLPKDVIPEERIRLAYPAASKKRALETVADLLASGQSSFSAAVVFEKLLERERLGSTGLANGIALPHARFQGVSKASGAFLRLEEGIDFDAVDEQPVDLIFALLVPENATQEHLDLLAHLASLFRDPEFCSRIRQAHTVEEVHSLLTTGSDDVAPDSSTGSVRLPA